MFKCLSISGVQGSSLCLGKWAYISKNSWRAFWKTGEAWGERNDIISQYLDYINNCKVKTHEKEKNSQNYQLIDKSIILIFRNYSTLLTLLERKIKTNFRFYITLSRMNFIKKIKKKQASTETLRSASECEHKKQW